MRDLLVFHLAGLVDYLTALKYQKFLRELIHRKNHPDTLLLLEHPSVYTLGRGATTQNLKVDLVTSRIEGVYRMERGGEVTWHGPGQLVAYPIFNLNRHQRDLHW